jgi:HNH endonuclease
MNKSICPQCNKEFFYYPSMPKKYCSRQCQRDASRITTKCPKCGKEFWYHKSWPRIYCSRGCSASVNGRKNFGKYADGVGFTETSCDNCGKSFMKQTRDLKKTKHSFCGVICFGKWLSNNIIGEAHPNWNGGRLPYYGPNWRQQRRNARARDNYTCQKCGITEKKLGKNLDVHHKKPFRKFGIKKYKEANALENLISLCNVCHTTVEHNGL